MNKNDDQRSLSELKGKTKSNLNISLCEKRNNTKEIKKNNSSSRALKTSLTKEKDKKTINLNNSPMIPPSSLPFVKKNPNTTRKIVYKKKDISPLIKSIQDPKKPLTNNKSVTPNKNDSITAVKNKITDIQKKIKDLTIPLKNIRNINGKLNEDSLNNSNLDNLTATTADRTKNNEEENSSKIEKKKISPLNFKKIPNGLSVIDKNKKNFGDIQKFINKIPTEANIKKIVLNQSNNRCDTSLSIQECRNKLNEKLDFRTLNTSPNKKKVKFYFYKKKLKTINENDKSNLKNTSPKKKLVKILSQKELVSKAKDILLTDPRDCIIKKEIKNYHHISKTGFDGVAQKKDNQDNFFNFKNLNGNITSRFFGVCDGHGVYGHKVSMYLKNHLPLTLDKRLKNNFFNKNISEVITETFVDINNNLGKEIDINSDFSGSTCVSLIYSQEKLITANVGDSRAIVGRFENGEWVGINITRDHKPSDKDEAERIKKNNGRIFPFKDENNEDIGPQRVWIKDDDIPGLAMSRSFGDKVASTVGVTCIPEIKEYKFNKGDSFFILASDGLWEFIDSNECANFVKDYYIKNDITGACDYLYNESKKRWMKEEEVIDDITIILVFLK